MAGSIHALIEPVPAGAYCAGLAVAGNRGEIPASKEVLLLHRPNQRDVFQREPGEPQTHELRSAREGRRRRLPQQGLHRSQ
jgi:hypothetical protein